MDLKIAENRTVALAVHEETDEQDGNILQGMRFLCAKDNEIGTGKDDQKHKIRRGGAPNRRSLNSNKWQGIRYEKYEKDN